MGQCLVVCQTNVGKTNNETEHIAGTGWLIQYIQTGCAVSNHQTLLWGMEPHEIVQTTEGVKPVEQII
jgi:hypothetical protein